MDEAAIIGGMGGVAQTTPDFSDLTLLIAEDIERCLRSGMKDHLAKPIDINSVAEKIKRYCQ